MNEDTLSVVSDALSAALTKIKLRALINVALDAGGNWAIDFPALNGFMLNVVQKGEMSRRRLAAPDFQHLLRELFMPFANYKFPQGTLDAAQKEAIIHRTTAMFVEYFGEGVRPYSMVLVDEVADGGWGRADETLTMEKMGIPRG